MSLDPVVGTPTRAFKPTFKRSIGRAGVYKSSTLRILLNLLKNNDSLILLIFEIFMIDCLMNRAFKRWFKRSIFLLTIFVGNWPFLKHDPIK